MDSLSGSLIGFAERLLGLKLVVDLEMDYFSLLRQRLTQPLVQRQAAGVEEVRLKFPRPLEIPKPRPNGARPVFGSGDWAAG